MKKTFFALTLLVGLLLPLASRAQAETEVSLNLFYDNLSTEGNWIDVGDYGYCFQPNVAASDSNWRPYADGYWAYTDAGWTWVSYEDFGWATYHYGRWTQLEDYGWVWVPGLEWSGAWVSWRTGGDYVGWAPLPPAVEPVYEGRAITGHLDVEFDIGPTFYNFVDVRYLGEPVLRQRLVEPSLNVTIINNTVNVTNITYNNTTVINSGPNFEQVNRYSVRPVQRMQLQRETAIANLNLQGGGRRNFNQVNGNQLRVIAPQLQKPTQKFAPKQVKATVKAPKVEHGWKNVPDREKLQARMKNEDSKNVPPPTIPAQQGRRAEAAVAEPEAAQPNDNKNAGPANENNGARERNQQAARTARQDRANAREPKVDAQAPNANQANEAANAPAGENARAARPAKRAEKADQANSADNAGNAQAAPRAKRKAARAELAQAAEDSTTNEQPQQPADKAAQRDSQPGPRDQTEQRAAHRAQRDEAPKAEAAPDHTDNQNNGQQDRAQQQERRKARQENRAEQQPQPEQAQPRQPQRNNPPADDSKRPQPADQSERAPGQQRQQAVRQERAQQREQKQNEAPQNAPSEHRKKKAAPEETPTPPQP